MSKALLLLPIPIVAFGAGLAASDTLPSPATLIVPMIIILVLVVINGFFVAAEFAIIGVRPSEVDQMVQEGTPRAGEIQDIQDSPAKQDRYIATAQLGITIASLGLGMYGEPRIAEFVEPYLALIFEDPSSALVHTVSSVIALGLLTYLHIVIGEMVPKSLALSSPDQAVLRIARPMSWAQTILSIPVRALNGIGRAMLKLFKIEPAEGEARLHSAEELELIVSESAEGGLLLEEEEEMIRNIFDFSERQVGQVMTARPKVQAISLGMTLDELLPVIISSRHSRFPVYEGDLDHVVGLLHLKDLARQQLRSKGELDLRLILRPAPAVPEDQPVEQLLTAFKRQRIHMAIVLDEFGGMSGVVTLEDLVEEIVGEVRDEFDFEREPLVELAPGELEVVGTFLVDDLFDYVYLGEESELPDVDTVGGLIHTWLGRPPQVGDTIPLPDSSHVVFTVLDVDGLAVARAKVEFPVGEDEGDSPGNDKNGAQIDAD
ncbi:MAG: HlyC/CorC family transporter [Chloroflexota bacterium]|nr:MAG: HlyC/CorC family transporter [Chloroflexota bacterium]